jgi:hypothetical protein
MPSLRAALASRLARAHSRRPAQPAHTPASPSHLLRVPARHLMAPPLRCPVHSDRHKPLTSHCWARARTCAPSSLTGALRSLARSSSVPSAAPASAPSSSLDAAPAAAPDVGRIGVACLGCGGGLARARAAHALVVRVSLHSPWPASRVPIALHRLLASLQPHLSASRAGVAAAAALDFGHAGSVVRAVATALPERAPCLLRSPERSRSLVRTRPACSRCCVGLSLLCSLIFGASRALCRRRLGLSTRASPALSPRAAVMLRPELAARLLWPSERIWSLQSSPPACSCRCLGATPLHSALIALPARRHRHCRHCRRRPRGL